ncbi:hypothetical protein ILUMI_16977, partial [Ignelater luminosus]
MANNSVEDKKKKKKRNCRDNTNKSGASNYVARTKNKQRRVARDTVKRARKQSWEECGRQIEEDFEQDQKLFYQVLKNMRKI